MNSTRRWLLAQLRALSPLALGAALCMPAIAQEEYGQEPPLPGNTVESPSDPANIDDQTHAIALENSAALDSSGKPGECQCDQCQSKKEADAKAKLQKAVAGAYKGVFYDNNFDYLCNPAYDDWHLGENFKRMCLGDFGVLDIGGEYRARYHHEKYMRGLGLSGNSDDFLLQRTRLYMNAELGERFRVYGEMLDADSNWESFNPRPIEVNRTEMLNLFGDLTILDNDSSKLIGRVGRQELLYGDQRLISPLDWANVRRTFDGAKLMLTHDDWRVDGFWTRPVNYDGRNFDSPDQDQQFYGAYSTYSGKKDHTFDFYWLGYQSDRPLHLGEQPFAIQTAGTRWAATHGPWLSTLEAGYQFGTYGNGDHSAGFVTVGAGHKWEDVCWQPVLWSYYDWASGDATLGNGFNQLFPLGHKYLGFMDFYARSNIQDINFTLTGKPHDKLTALMWWHIFFLADTNDVPYNVNGRPFVNTAGGDRYLGQELDFLFTYNITPRSDIVFGYSHFFTGDWYRTNPIARNGYTGDADFFYTQFTLRF